MGNFIVSARKYRPNTFDDVIGQQAIANTLKRAIVNQKLASAYLFCGPRGVGKTTCARIFAKAINCLHPKADGEACDECESCQSFLQQRSMNIQELNAAANNSVDDIRAIIEQVRIPPQIGHYKIIILDEVHMLSQNAANALLKTLEEPPSYVIFILATTEKQKMLPTILSRCQIFDFNRMEINDIVTQLKKVADKEGIAYEETAFNVIAQKADGGMRDALSIFDQVTNFSGGNITYESVLRSLNVLDYDYYFKMTTALLKHEISTALILFNEIVNKGFNGGVFISGLASHFRDLLVSRDTSTIPLLDVADNVKQRYTEQAKLCSVKFLYRAIRRCDRCGNEYRTSYNKRLSVEITLIEVGQLSDSDEDAGLRPTTKLKPIFKETNKGPQTVATPAPVYETAKSAAPEPQAQAAPQAAAPKAPPVAPMRRIGTPSIHLNLGHSTVTESAPQETKPSAEAEQNIAKEERPIGLSPYDEQGLNYYWNKYADELPPSEGAVKGRMKGMQVILKEDKAIEVHVNNEDVLEYMKPIIPQVEKYLRKALDNSGIKLNLKVISTKQEEIIYNPRELFAEMMKHNKNLAEMQKELGLELD